MDAGAGERPGELVQRVVAADILARGHDTLAGHVEPRRMHRTCLGVQRLLFRQEFHRLHDVGRRKRKRRLTYIVHRTHRLLDGFDAAEAAADRPGEPPAPRLEARVGLVLQTDLDVDAGAEVLDLDRLDLLRRRNDTFGQREAEREILEIGG